jgi:hypothetical protein
LTDPIPKTAGSLRTRLEFAAKAFIVTSFAGVLVAGAVRLGEKALASREHRIDLSRWTVLERPEWSTLDDVKAIRAQSGLSSYWASLYDGSALATVDSYLARSPSVKRVAEVRRVYPNRLEAVMELRRPVVAVAVRAPGKAELYVETDDEGVALTKPLAARPVREGRPLRVVVGAATTAPAPGHAFGPEVVAAASLADSLDTFSDDKGRALLALLDRIDVSNWGGRARPGTSEVQLSASPPAPPPKAAPGSPAPPPSPPATKCVVEWGRAGDRDADGDEMPFDAKASRLLQALRLFPGLQGLRTVKVAFNDLVVVPDASNAPHHLKRALEIDGGVQSK